MSWKKIAFLEEVAVLSDTAPVDVTIAAASAGVATDAARQDHKHDINVKLDELEAPTGPVALNSQRITGLGAVTTAGDAIPANADLRAPDSAWLEGDSKATVQDHTPQTHAPSHKSAGGDPVLLNEFGDPTGAIEINKQSLVNPVIDPQISDPATPVDGQIYYKTADDHLYVYVAA